MSSVDIKKWVLLEVRNVERQGSSVERIPEFVPGQVKAKEDIGEAMRSDLP